MKLLFENWKRYLKEGDVIPVDFSKKRTSEPVPEREEAKERAISLVNRLEDAIGEELEAGFNARHGKAPGEKYEDIEEIMKILDDHELFDKLVKLFTVEELVTR